MENILDNVNFPEDIRNFNTEQLRQLCAEIREYMIDCCSKNPGHLGSSLGAVELITGLHYVYNTPEDKIVFDVSHQAYAHKILTGRKEAFRKNRMKDGISGFTKREESPYDCFGAGHSSTSISAALGFAYAAKMQGSDSRAVALIGDGALSGGLAFEGLNNASDADVLVIINDNNISIDKNIGAVHEHLLRITTSVRYNRLKNKVWNSLGEGRLREMAQRLTVSAKSSIVKSSGGDFFEALGFRYFGPIDGNDIEQVVDVLRRLKNIKGPKILHAITTKGKGFAPAEEDQTAWHAPGMFDPQTGKRIKKNINVSRYQDVFGEVLLELARRDSRVAGITPAMASGCGMNILAHEMPDRFFDVGIAEEHAVTFSAGLAAAGMLPFCNIYSSFSQRAYDQVIHDVALQKLPVVLCLDRAGLVGEDGPTHHGNFDLAAFRCIPDTVIAVPSDEIELKNMMYSATLAKTGPYIIRYPRGYGEGLNWRDAEYEYYEPGKGVKVLDGEGLAVIAAGFTVNCAKRAAERMYSEKGIRPAIYNIRYVKPVDESILAEAAACGRIITVEDGTVKGGLYGEVSEYVASRGLECKVIPVGSPDVFISQGTQKELRHENGLDEDSLYELFLKEIKN